MTENRKLRAAVDALLACPHPQQQAMRLMGGAAWMRCRRCGAWREPRGEQWELPVLVAELADATRDGRSRR